MRAQQVSWLAYGSDKRGAVVVRLPAWQETYLSANVQSSSSDQSSHLPSGNRWLFPPRCVKLTANRNLMPMLKMRGTIPRLPHPPYNNLVHDKNLTTTCTLSQTECGSTHDIECTVTEHFMPSEFIKRIPRCVKRQSTKCVSLTC